MAKENYLTLNDDTIKEFIMSGVLNEFLSSGANVITDIRLKNSYSMECEITFFKDVEGEAADATKS